MSVLIVILVVLVILGYLIYLSRKNQKLEREIEAEKKAKDEQIEITKTYEKYQERANEIKNEEKTVADSGSDVAGIIGSGNDSIASFNNRVSNNKK